METSSVNDNITCSGALFYALNTKRFLFLQRTKNKTIGQWGLVGGMSEKGETPWNSLQREIKEEIGVEGNFKKVIPLELFTSKDEKYFNTRPKLTKSKTYFNPLSHLLCLICKKFAQNRQLPISCLKYFCLQHFLKI